MVDEKSEVDSSYWSYEEFTFETSLQNHMGVFLTIVPSETKMPRCWWVLHFIFMSSVCVLMFFCFSEASFVESAFANEKDNPEVMVKVIHDNPKNFFFFFFKKPLLSN